MCIYRPKDRTTSVTHISNRQTVSELVSMDSVRLPLNGDFPPPVLGHSLEEFENS
jgi:hypothetical protein